MLREGLRGGLPRHRPVGARPARPRVSAEHARADGRARRLLLLDRARPAAVRPGCSSEASPPGHPRSSADGPRLATLGAPGLVHGDGRARGCGVCSSSGSRSGRGSAAVRWRGGRPGAAATRHRPRGCSTPRRRSPRCSSGCSAGCSARGRASPRACRLFPRDGRVPRARCPTRCSTRSWCRHSAPGRWLFSRFRVFQQGNIRIYVLYIFLALIVLLLWR